MEDFDMVRLPEADYLMFQGQPFREEDYCEAILKVQHAMDEYRYRIRKILCQRSCRSAERYVYA